MAWLNVQADLRQRLAGALGVPVRVKVPDEIPQRCVVVVRNGGRVLNKLQDRAGVDFYAYGTSEADACSLMADVRAEVFTLPFEGGYELMQEETCRSDYDEKAKRYRWYSSWTITTHKPIH